MDQRELHAQPLGICYRIYHFIMKTLASQALKTVTLGRPMPFGSTKVETSSDCSEEDQVEIQTETKEQQGEEKNNPCMNMNMNEEKKMVAPEKAPKKMVSINDNVEEIYTGKKRKKRSKSFQKSNSLEQQQGEEEIKPLRSILKVKSNLDEKSKSEC